MQDTQRALETLQRIVEGEPTDRLQFAEAVTALVGLIIVATEQFTGIVTRGVGTAAYYLRGEVGRAILESDPPFLQ